MSKSRYTREQCKEALLACSSSNELLKRFPGIYRRVYEHERDLLQYASWTRKDRLTDDERSRREQGKAERKTRREARKAEREAEHIATQQRKAERAAFYADKHEAEEREKTERKAERERLYAERKAEREAEHERNITEWMARRAEQNAAYLRGEVKLSSNPNYHTEDECKRLILEAGSMKALRKSHRGVFNAIYKRYPHLKDLLPRHRLTGHKNPEREHWTMEWCREQSLQFSSVNEERERWPELHWWIQRRGWSKFCHEHMRIRKDGTTKNTGGSRRYATSYRQVLEHIMECHSEEEFAERYPDEVERVSRVKTLRETADSHFPAVQKRRIHERKSVRLRQQKMVGYRRLDGRGGLMRAIYACEFPDGYAYVGLTDDLDYRRRQHGYISRYKESAVAAHKWKTGQQFEFKILSDFMPEEDAKLAEAEWENRYEADGWKLLNRAPTGSLGGSGYAGVPMWQD